MSGALIIYEKRLYLRVIVDCMIDHPKGFLVMDTCCFIDYIEGSNEHFDYSRIKTFIQEASYWVVITPYTLYEIIQKLNDVELIRKRRNELLAIGDFWVINMNKVLEFDGFEYGLDFLFRLHMTRDEDILKFDEERFYLREKVYHSLFKKMFFFAQLVAIACVFFEECDDDGVIPYDAYLQIKMIDDFFDNGNEELIEWNFDRFFAQSDGKDFMGEDGQFHKRHDAKEILNEQLWDLIIQILSKTRVRQEIASREESVDVNEYNRRIVEQYYYLIRDKYKDNKHCLGRLLKDCKRRTSGKVGIDRIVRFAFGKSDFDINMLGYKKLLEDQFSNSGIGKKFCNHFIDMTIVAMVESFNKDNVIVLTSDEVWQDILLNSENRCKRINVDFYNKYKL